MPSSAGSPIQPHTERLSPQRKIPSVLPQWNILQDSDLPLPFTIQTYASRKTSMRFRVDDLRRDDSQIMEVTVGNETTLLVRAGAKRRH